MSFGKRVALAIVILLVAQAAGISIVPAALLILSGWLLAWPAPDPHFADMIGHLGWPIAVLSIAWLLRRPIARAAYLLAERMKTDDLKIGGFLQINKVPFNTMDRRVAAEHVDVAPVAEDVDAMESLLEYAGLSDENAARLLDWIEARHGIYLDPEEFMTEPRFANERRQAYIELVPR